MRFINSNAGTIGWVLLHCQAAKPRTARPNTVLACCSTLNQGMLQDANDTGVSSTGKSRTPQSVLWVNASQVTWLAAPRRMAAAVQRIDVSVGAGGSRQPWGNSA
jgi:hypothetical protein